MEILTLKQYHQKFYELVKKAERDTFDMGTRHTTLGALLDLYVEYLTIMSDDYKSIEPLINAMMKIENEQGEYWTGMYSERKYKEWYEIAERYSRIYLNSLDYRSLFW